MDDSKKTIFKDAIKYGLILGLIGIIIAIIIYVFDLVTMSLWSGAVIGIVNIIIYFIVFLVLMKNYRIKVLGGFMKYGRGLVFGLIIGTYAAILTAGFNYLLNAVIDPDYQKNTMEKVTNMTVDYLYSTGMSDEMIDQTIERMENREIPSAIGSSLMAIPGTIILSFIVSLIAAAFAKKKKDPYEAAMEGVSNEDTGTENTDS